MQQIGKANGAGGHPEQIIQNGGAITVGANASSNGAFDTSAIKNKLSVKRPPGGKVWHKHLLMFLLEPVFIQLTLVTIYHQMSKKALMERAKEDRKKSDNGEKAKNKPKVSLCDTERACYCHPACRINSVAGTLSIQFPMYLQEARKWATGHSKNESLDYSEKSDGVRGASDGDSGAESINMQQKSLVDMEEDIDSEDSEEVGAIATKPNTCKFTLKNLTC